MSSKKIKIKINGKPINCFEGQAVLEVAQQNNIHIPSLCDHPDFGVKANCRVCVVEIKGQKKLQTSCSTIARDGMEIYTESARIEKVRNNNIELIFAEHIEKCATCVWRFECKLLDYASRYKILITTFEDRKGNRKTHKFANAVELDGTQCIDCRNCIDACSVLQDINYLELKGKGHHQEVVPVKDKKIDCIYCGQCALHCPVSAAQEQTHWEEVEDLLKKKRKIMIAQFAPSIRVSIGEDFGVPYGKDMTGQISASLRALGFDYVFDVNFAADVTTMVEAEELLDRVANGGELPMFTSCCPGWVKYAEFYYPELLPNLTTARSPQIHNGGIIKTYWAKKAGVDPKDIVVVSIMPCTAKKFEAARDEMKVNNMLPVDYSLTTRELTFMIKKHAIDFVNLENDKPEQDLVEHSGAAVIYGASGGVMESALRTAQHMACEEKEGKLCSSRLDFKQVRGLDGIKEATVKVGGLDVKVAIVNGIKHAPEVIEKMKDYHYIEVMACPGGCIGGGGQPIPTTPEIRKHRMEALYRMDKDKKIRKAHENKGVLEALRWLNKQSNNLSHSVLHTKYKKRKRGK